MTFKWGTVTGVSPLRVKMDGDTSALPVTLDLLIDPLSLVVSDRVRVEVDGTRRVVHGRAGGLVAWRGINRPAFQAVGTSTVTKSGTVSTSILIYDSEIFDQLGDYDHTTGRFTAPVAGLYQFSFTAIQQTNVGGPEFSFFKNGSSYFGKAAIGYYTAYMTFGNTVIMKLAAGDIIDVRWQNNNDTTVIIDSFRSYFSGYYIG